MQDRRNFLRTLAAVGAAAAASRADARQGAPPTQKLAGGGIRKAVLLSMLPKELPYEQRFAVAKQAGFEAVELPTITKEEEATEIRDAAKKAGLRIHSVMNSDHWRYPLSSSNADDVNRSIAGMETSLRNAKLWGADAVLLVPAVVDAKTPYRDAYTRSQKVIRERLLPMAQDLKVIIAIEEVWNKFLLSPLEFARYVDEFESPWVQAYFDVGNIVFYAFPQDWIRTLGKRIVKVHVKDFQLDRGKGQFFWRNIGEGDIDWPEVRRALSDINYNGYITTEIQGGDLTYLTDVSARLDKFLAGEKPFVKT